MEENNNQQTQQYQQYSAPQQPQQPQGAPMGNQFFQGFKAPNTEEGLKKKFADLKTIFLIIGILAAITVVIDLFTVIPTLTSPLGQLALAFNPGLRVLLIFAIIIDIVFCAIQWVGMVFAKKEDKKALILGIVAGGIQLLFTVIYLCTGNGFRVFGTILGVALIADCILTLNAYKAVRGNK